MIKLATKGKHSVSRFILPFSPLSFFVKGSCRCFDSTRGRCCFSSIATLAMPKQQVSLLSFFGGGQQRKKKRRPSISGTDDVDDQSESSGNVGASSSSLPHVIYGSEFTTCSPNDSSNDFSADKLCEDVADSNNNDDHHHQITLSSSPNVIIQKKRKVVNHDIIHVKSEYELLRERNIARNNARLESLGLLPAFVNDSSSISDVRPKKKRRGLEMSKTTTSMTNNLPTRKSTRLTGQQPSLELREENIDEVNDALLEKKSTMTKTLYEEEEFTVSPLVAYQIYGKVDDDTIGTCRGKDAMDSNNIDNLIGGEMQQLVPTGTRLVTPTGLNAIYSLQFYNTMNNDTDNVSMNKSSWLVGAGKSGIIALWNTNTTNIDCKKNNDDENNDSCQYIDPVITWKGHGGRWIADARFHPTQQQHSPSSLSAPGRLLTAGNDGTVCYWDLTSTSIKTGMPRLLCQSTKMLHTSGIFSMDVIPSSGGDGDVWIGTGSKDKSIAISTLGRLNEGRPLWSCRNFHSAKVSSVCFSTSDMVNPLIASASDDGLVAVHDARIDGGGSNNNGVVARLEGTHYKPHSIVWKPNSDRDFVTAGLDEMIKLWDLRNTISPIVTYHGHVPVGAGRKLKRIHRPTFFNTSSSDSFILSGGENSHAISLFQLKNRGLHDSCTMLQPVFSRGKLPLDVGDVGSVATYGKHVAIATEGGEVLLLSQQ